MPQQTRQRICDTAVKLFNERGYSAVSLRQIAAEAGTTIGNLTYHFAKKDDLLQAILSDLHSGFSDLLADGLRGHKLLDHIVNLIATHEANQTAYPFYFKNIAEIHRQSAALFAEGSEFALRLYRYYRASFLTLQQDGIMRNDVSVALLERLAYSIVQMESSWMEANNPYANDLIPRVEVAQAVCSLLAAYVAPEAIQDFYCICEQHGIAL